MPTELLRMINGRAKPTKAVIASLARELDSDVRYLAKLAAEIELPVAAMSYMGRLFAMHALPRLQRFDLVALDAHPCTSQRLLWLERV